MRQYTKGLIIRPPSMGFANAVRGVTWSLWRLALPHYGDTVEANDSDMNLLRVSTTQRKEAMRKGCVFMMPGA